MDDVVAFAEFPAGFSWGSATASYQIEGRGGEKSGRGVCIWDAFCQTPKRVNNSDTGEIATDHIRRFESDVALMREMGLKKYRFSISWPRIFPSGRRQDGVNEAGVLFYNSLIDELVKNGIEPVVTLYHWDLPLALQVEEDGWLNTNNLETNEDNLSDIVLAFADYANFCFATFGDRVTEWITINEPWVIAVLGFATGEHAPGRKMNPHTEPYIAGHNLLLAHAKAVEIYRQKYQKDQNGRIGISLNCDWREAKYSKDKNIYEKNKLASERSLVFFLAWFADPIYFGDYPTSMKETCGARLPTFTSSQKKIIQGSNDFFGLNHYGTVLAEEESNFDYSVENRNSTSYWHDISVKCSDDEAWLKTDMDWNVVPWGFRKLLIWITERYNQPTIVVTENGCAVKQENAQDFCDDFRIQFLESYIFEMYKAITEHNVKCTGYFVWSLLDNFEWAFGYGKRFGMYHVNYKTLERTPKNSVAWYTNVIAENGLRPEWYCKNTPGLA